MKLGDINIGKRPAGGFGVLLLVMIAVGFLGCWGVTSLVGSTAAMITRRVHRAKCR